MLRPKLPTRSADTTKRAPNLLLDAAGDLMEPRVLAAAVRRPDQQPAQHDVGRIEVVGGKPVAQKQHAASWPSVAVMLMLRSPGGFSAS